jgi:hypothetical protein
MNTEDMDDSWIAEEERVLAINKDLKREELEYIKIYFCFLDVENAISKITSMKYTFSNENDRGDYTRILTENEILSMIESKKNDDLRNYVFSDMLLYTVDIEATHINLFNQSVDEPGDSHFLKHYTIVSDVVFPSSIFIFHSINGLYILLKEKLIVKSILKKTIGNNTTRKNVKFSDNVEVVQKHKTRRTYLA